MISASIVDDTSMFQIRVTNTNKEHAYIIAQYIYDNAPEKVRDIVKPWIVVDEEGQTPEQEDAKRETVTECITAINRPYVAKTHDSPSLVKNVAVSGVITALVVYIICLFKSFFNTVVKTEDDIKPITDKYPLIGRIPTWRKK